MIIITFFFVFTNINSESSTRFSGIGIQELTLYLGVVLEQR